MYTNPRRNTSKLGMSKEERGKRKEERGKRKEERGKRKEERGKRKDERRISVKRTTKMRKRRVVKINHSRFVGDEMLPCPHMIIK